jgi:hypothetical protein
MSVLKHATVSAWSRQEDGSYAAEINGWTLRVKWRPEAPGQRRGFLWEARREGGIKFVSQHLHEEIEVAMAEAEECAAPSLTEHEGQTVD